MQSGNSSLIYGLEFQCRALASLECEGDEVQFVVGTQGHRTSNQIHVLQISDDDTKNLSKKIYEHPQGEIWQIVSNQVESNVIAVRHSNLESDGSQKQSVSVYKLNDNLTLEYEISDKDLHHVSWMPGNSKFMTLAENKLCFYDLNSQVPQSIGKLEGKGLNELTYGSWNPHQNSQQFATVNEYHIRGWDVRTMKQVWNFESPGNQSVRCIDFNPNKQYFLASSGDDGAVRFWDIRQPRKALAVRNDHSHWIWSVKYNPYHDQLILTSSSDGHVVLSSMASLSSEPQGHLIEDEDNEEANESTLEDGKISSFDDHEDSVYCAEWSATDPWIFASLSYDGRLVINHVPRNIKFRILNLM